MKEASFTDDLAWSGAQSTAPWWEKVYREAFPSLVSMRVVSDDGWAQRGGIDRIIGLADGTNITVDEKARREDWPDIALEFFAEWRENGGRRVPGWAHPGKFLTCDYIAYAMVPTATCYLLPYQLLRRAVLAHGHQWWDACEPRRNGFRFVDSPNRFDGRTWITRSVAVPTAVLLNAIRDVMVISWGGA